MGGVVPGFFFLLAWAIFLGASALAAVLGAILFYHWVRYARSGNAALIAALIYSVGCLLILTMLLGAVLTLRS